MPILKSMTRVIRVLLPAAAAVSVAGCSADVARFDSAGFSGSDNQQTSSIPIPPASVYSPTPRAGLLGDGDGASHQPPPMADGSRGGDVRVAELPPTSNGYGQSPRSYDGGYQAAPPARSYDRSAAGYDSVPAEPYDAAPRARRPAEPRIETAAYSPAGGDTVEVKPGDTLYSLSRQHGVKVNDIMSANDLKGHSLKPGQRLTMPSGSGANRADPISGAVTPPVADAAPVSSPAAAPESSTVETAGTYTMKPGDSLYTIARQHKVNYAELQRANGITDESVRKIRPGTVLKIPAGSTPQATRASTTVSLSATGTHLPVPSDAPAAAADKAATMPAAESVTAAPAATPAPSSEPVKPDATASADTPKVLNSAPNEPAAGPAQADQKVAALDTKTTTDANPAGESKPAEDKSVSSSGRLRWPVQGRIISAFGPRPDGTHNDGVNFSVPQGTDVHAAEGGEVIYVGDELKAYGKLVLLRHDNGWVTAYAHNEDLLVTRGKKVARGDVIAKAGKTGPVDQPQVHFELRQDSKAVDPTSFMEKQ